MRKHKHVVFLLVLALLAGPVLPGLAKTFPDLPAGDHWAKESVEILGNLGLVIGYPDGEFKGDRPATRYEMAMVIQRIWYKLIMAIEGLKEEKAGEVKPVEDTLTRMIEELVKSKGLVTPEQARQIAREEAKKLVDELLKATDDLAPELRERGVQVDELKKLAGRIDTRLTDVESKVASLMKDMEGLEAEFAAFQKKMGEKCTQLEGIQRDVKSLQETTAAQGERIGKLEEKTNKLEEMVKSNTERIGAIEERLNKYQLKFGANIISDGWSVHNGPAYLDPQDLWTNNLLAPAASQFSTSDYQLGLGFNVNLGVTPQPDAYLNGDATAYFLGTSPGNVPRAYRFRGTAKLADLQLGVNAVGIPAVFSDSFGRKLGEERDVAPGEPLAWRDYKEAGLMLAVAPLTFISRSQEWLSSRLFSATQMLQGGATFSPYGVGVDVTASYKQQKTWQEGSSNFQHEHNIARLKLSKEMNIQGYNLAFSAGLAQKYAEADNPTRLNKTFIMARLLDWQAFPKIHVNVNGQYLNNGSDWESDLDAGTWGPNLAPQLREKLAANWNEAEDWLNLGADWTYAVTDGMTANGGYLLGYNYTDKRREGTLDFGIEYTFDLANWGLPTTEVVAGYNYQMRNNLVSREKIGKFSERRLKVTRTLADGAQVFGSMRLLQGSSDLGLDDSKDRYLAVGYTRNFVGALVNLRYENVGTDGQFLAPDAKKTDYDRFLVDVQYNF